MAALIAWDILLWLWTRGISEYILAWKNLHWFLYHYFSVPVLIQTFFAPFRRLSERRARGFDLEDWAGVFAVNTLMRVVGVVVRSAFLVVALASQVVLFLAAGAVFILFASAFISIPALIIAGLIFIFRFI